MYRSELSVLGITRNDYRRFGTEGIFEMCKQVKTAGVEEMQIFRLEEEPLANASDAR